MLQGISKWLLYSFMGWKKDVRFDIAWQSLLICLAPHTSNYDFLIGQLYARAEQQKSNFLMKKEWFFWPLGPIFRKLGGIPVWRDKKTSMNRPISRLCYKGWQVPALYYSRRNQKSKPWMEKGVLLYCTESTTAYLPLRVRLWKEANRVFKGYNTIGRFGTGYEGNQIVFQRL